MSEPNTFYRGNDTGSIFARLPNGNFMIIAGYGPFLRQDGGIIVRSVVTAGKGISPFEGVLQEREFSRVLTEVPTDCAMLNCPHCLAFNVFVRRPYRDARHHVECRICDMRGPTKTSVASAVEAWNQLPR